MDAEESVSSADHNNHSDHDNHGNSEVGDLSISKKDLNNNSSATDIERDPNKDPYDEELSEQEILDIAEKVFIKISEEMK